MIKSLLISACLITSGGAMAKAPVWKVSKGDQYLYLGGTVHLLSQDDYPLPEAFEKAYADADDIWFETDGKQLSAPETQAKLLGVMMFQDERSLSMVLDKGTYEQLSAFLTERGMPMAVFEKFTPAGMMFTLTALELKRLGLIDETAGVDMHFETRAEKDGKDRRHLETIDEQVGFMNSMNQLEPNKLIKSSLEEISKTADVWEDLLKAWRTGDMTLMEKVGIADMKSEFPLIYQTLLLNRNTDWAEDLDAMLKTDDIEFVLVGALHMAGDDGLIKKLKARGYTIEQLD